jgi:tetratricopeptide (TPR) repeat protein
MASENPASLIQCIRTGAADKALTRVPAFWIVAILAGLTAISYSPIVKAQFINYDDNEYVTANPLVLRGLSWEGVRWAFTTTHASNWHPVAWLSHMVDVELFGKGPMGPHLMSLLLHTANTVLLFLLLRRITGAQWRSALVAGLFALHPLLVESVAWVAERKDVLSGLFGFLTLIAYARYSESKVQGPRSEGTSGVEGCEEVKSEGRRAKEIRTPNSEVEPGVVCGSRPRVWYGLALVLFMLGLMSKPMLVTLPFVMLVLDYWPLGRVSGRTQIGRLVAEKIPFFLMSVVGSYITTRAQKLAIQPLEHLPLAERVANALMAYARYLGKTVWPADLALPYLHPGHWPAMHVAAAAMLLIFLSVVAVLGARNRPYLLTGWCWFLGTLIPVIGLVQVGTQSMADRYTYLPLIGLFIASVWGLGELCVRARIPKVVMALAGTGALICGSALTFQQATFWKDSERLFKHAAEATTDNYIAVANVGGALFEAGRLDEAMEFYRRSYQMNPLYAEAVNSIGAVLAARGSDEAIQWFKQALQIQPAHPQALFNLGNAMAKQGHTLEAVDYFQAALRVRPDNYEARNNLANALIKLHRLDEAIEQYKSALYYQPEAALIHKNLGEALAGKGQLDEAIGEYRQALRYTNDAAAHYSLGLTLAVQTKWAQAIEQYGETLRLSPWNAEAHYNLGYALRIKGRLEEAAAQFREALRLRPEFPLAHYNLGCVLVEKGDRNEAVAQLTEALRQKPDYREAEENLRALGVLRIEPETKGAK